MRLKTSQKQELMKYLAEGLTTPEINERAGQFNPPFSVSRQQLDYYRQSRKIKIKEIQQSGEFDALNTGLALKDERVRTLKRLVHTLIDEVIRESDNRRWLNNSKMLGSGEYQIRFDYEEFNKAEYDTIRELLDDIAQEVGDRIKGVDFTSGGKEITIIPLGVKIDDV